MTKPFCAICIADIVGEPVFEPLGKDDALVAVCHRCAGTKPAVVNVKPKFARSVKIAERRERYAALGLCIYGKKHGRATHGKLCANCDRMARESNERWKQKDKQPQRRAA